MVSISMSIMYYYFVSIDMDTLRKELILWLKEVRNTRFHQNPILKISQKKILLRAKPTHNLIIKTTQKLMINL